MKRLIGFNGRQPIDVSKANSFVEDIRPFIDKKLNPALAAAPPFNYKPGFLQY
jgi:hypothetical protein